MKIAVTGGTGFIGRPLVQHLAQAGHHVVVLTRSPGRLARPPPNVTAARIDLRAPVPPATLQGVDALVHLAGENIAGRRWSEAHKREVLDSRVGGTTRIAEAAVGAGTVKTFVSASGIGFYGDRGAEPLTEASAPGTDFLAGVCRAWEEATRPAEDAGIRTVILRIAPVLHPEGGPLQKMLLPFRLGVGGRIGRGRQYMSWVHREDAIRFIDWALTLDGARGPFNLTAPEPVTNAAFTRALGRALRRPTLLPIPPLALRLVFGEVATTLVASQRVLPQRAQELGFTFRFGKIDEALRDLLVSPGPRAR